MRLSSILPAVALVAIGTTAFAQDQRVGAKIIVPVTVTNVGPNGPGSSSDPTASLSNMYFGTIVQGATGSIVLNPNQTTNPAARTVNSVTVAGTDYWMPEYQLGGSADQPIYVSVPNTTVYLGGNTTAASMTVTNFQWSQRTGAATLAAPQTANTTNTMTIPTGSTSTNFRLGATLNISSTTQAVGAYWGTYTITAAYN